MGKDRKDTTVFVCVLQIEGRSFRAVGCTIDRSGSSWNILFCDGNLLGANEIRACEKHET